MLSIEAMLILGVRDSPKQYKIMLATLTYKDGRLGWSRKPNSPSYSVIDKQVHPHLYDGPWINLSHIFFVKNKRYPFSWKTYFEACQRD